MGIETRNWSAVILTGASPRLIIEGEARTHPYAIAFLSEQGLVKGSPSALRVDLKVVGDTGTRGVLHWKPVIYERALGVFFYDRVVIGGGGEPPITLEVREMTADAYIRAGH